MTEGKGPMAVNRGKIRALRPWAVALLLAAFLAAPAGARPAGTPPLPWAEAERRHLPPGEPGRDYTPVTVPNGTALAFSVREGTKIFHLTLAPVKHEVAPGLTVNAWGYNGQVPGPVIEAVEGDRVRVYVTNRLPASTAVHWHGMLLPSGMDGVSGLTQAPIRPGETFRYEFHTPRAGTFMYHSHHDSMTQEGLGLNGMFVVHPRSSPGDRPDRDFAIMLHEWAVAVGASSPDTLESVDFNVLTMNGKAFPATAPLLAELGDTVRVRLGNLSAMSHHPIHLHGYSFRVVETDGGRVPESARQPETTVLVPVGSVRVIELYADNPGDWFMHCHMTHHTMNQMGHGLPNMVGVDPGDLDRDIRKLIPGYMTLGVTGMDHAGHAMPMPENSIPMLGGDGPFGPTLMGGMATIFKVRERLPRTGEGGWHQAPPGTQARPATAEEMAADHIQAQSPPDGMDMEHLHMEPMDMKPMPMEPTDMEPTETKPTDMKPPDALSPTMHGPTHEH